MYLIPLTQPESVELVIHVLRAAAGQADCSSCPVRKVCTKQCLALADGVERMLAEGTLPTVGEEPPPPPAPTPGAGSGGGSRLKLVK